MDSANLFGSVLLLSSDHEDEDIKISSEDEVDDPENILLFLSAVFRKELKSKKFRLRKKNSQNKPNPMKGYLCIEKDLFRKLQNDFHNSPAYQAVLRHRAKYCLSAEYHLLTFLWFVSHKNMSYRQVAEHFKITASTVYTATKRIYNFLCDMYPTVVQWPEPEERQISEILFGRSTGISGIVGSVCVTFIQLLPNSLTLNLNVKEKKLIPLLLVFNEKNKVIYAYVGEAETTPTNIFEKSGLQEKLATLEEGEHLVGGTGFPCLENLVTPFEGSDLDMDQLFYNQRIEKCLNECELNVKLLKATFRQLDSFTVRYPSLQESIIKACLVLYNLSDIGIQGRDENIQIFDVDTFDSTDLLRGVEKRMDIVESLFK